MAAAVEELTESTFDEAVNGSPVPVVVDFWAEWCPPCKAIAPILDAIAAEHRHRLRIVNVDVGEHPELAARFSVMSFPTLLVFRDGQVVKRLIGARGKAHLLEELSELLS